MLEHHHKHSRHFPLPLAFVLFVHSPDAIPHSLFISRDLLQLWPVLFSLRHFTVPMIDFGLVVNVGVDSPLENVGKMCRRRQRLVEVPGEMDVAEGGGMSNVEKWNVSKRNRLRETE